MVCGVRTGLHRFDPARSQFDLLATLEPDRPQTRLNDGFVAPDGTLWFGSMDDSEATVSGALYRYSRGEIKRHDDGYRVTNGPALSRDGRTLYHNDTTERREPDDGYPDGRCVDAAGVLHVGLFNDCGGHCQEGSPGDSDALVVDAVVVARGQCRRAQALPGGGRGIIRPQGRPGRVASRSARL